MEQVVIEKANNQRQLLRVSTLYVRESPVAINTNRKETNIYYYEFARYK